MLRVMVVLAAMSAAAVAAPCEIAPSSGTGIAIDGLTATLTFGDRTRVVTAASCAELADAVALILAMADAPASEATSPAVAKQPPDGGATGSPTDGGSAIGVRAEASRSVPIAFDLSAGGASTYASHGWAQQASVGARWRREDRSLGVELVAGLPTSQAVDAVSSVAIWSAAATVAPCLHAGAFAGCALASAGILVGSGDQLDGARRAVTPLLALGARVAWEPAIADRLALRVHLDLVGNVATSRFDVDQMTVWASDRFAAWAGIDAIIHFP